MQRIIAFFLLIILSPLIMFTALIIALMEGLPIVFTQDRIGMNRKIFTIYKFRTMSKGQVTLIGKILRKTGIDELLQLVNIINGSMVFVGPRPLTQADIERLEWNKPSYDERWSVKPGITGMAQLVNICDKNVSLYNDLDYVKNRSIRLDMKILRRSILIPFVGKSKMKNAHDN